jgi:hypothetical protein
LWEEFASLVWCSERRFCLPSESGARASSKKRVCEKMAVTSRERAIAMPLLLQQVTSLDGVRIGFEHFGNGTPFDFREQLLETMKEYCRYESCGEGFHQITVDRIRGVIGEKRDAAT